MKKVLLTPFYLIAATFIGLGDTFYLSYYQHLGITPTCALGGCEIVLNSVYSKFMGIPLSYIGLVFYIYMLALAILLAYDPFGKGTRFALMSYTTVGLLFSIGFESLQVFVIHAICMYCAISAATTLLLFILAIWHWRSTRAKSI
ncbi:MAG TPA: vitamin K epoxide reductase family protein [Candidatus Paceibacterota bacterium]|nr:vitamin K epoxide reductase family protein [Candidatus Paceibacterota bacterium]